MDREFNVIIQSEMPNVRGCIPTLSHARSSLGIVFDVHLIYFSSRESVSNQHNHFASCILGLCTITTSIAQYNPLCINHLGHLRATLQVCIIRTYLRHFTRYIRRLILSKCLLSDALSRSCCHLNRSHREILTIAFVIKQFVRTSLPFLIATLAPSTYSSGNCFCSCCMNIMQRQSSQQLDLDSLIHNKNVKTVCRGGMVKSAWIIVW